MSTPPVSVLAAFGLERATLTPITVGNINLTFGVEHDGESLILQRLNPIFSPEVHLDIEAVTARLAAQGMITPRLRKTHTGAWWETDDAGGVWRVMSRIAGVNRSHVDDPAWVHSAGRLLARFHRTLWDYDEPFRSRRLGVHDTERHLGLLREVARDRRSHVAWSAAGPLAEQILGAAEALPPLGRLPERVVHGDPKINNIIFSEEGEALALIDLDTVARMPIPIELGDAFRSWCNPSGEDHASPTFRGELFAAGVRGYAEILGALLSDAERDALPDAVQLIALELAARFCADSLEERYFGWDRSRFAAAWEHHLLRARGQYALARSIAAQRPALLEATAQAFAR